MDFSGAILLVAGWFLNEIAKKFQMSRERRAHIGRALSNLLELHHQIRTIEISINQLSHHLGLPRDGEAKARQLLENVIPKSDGYVARYEEAIEQLSENDPLTAFRMRTTAQIPRLLNSLRTISFTEGMADEEIQIIERHLRGMLIPFLEKAIIELASLHGRSTHRKVKRMFSSPAEMPGELNKLVQEIKERQDGNSSEDVSQLLT